MKNNYEIRGEVTVIFIPYKGTIIETLIDTADLEKVKSYEPSWTARRCVYNHSKFYVYGNKYIRKNGRIPGRVEQTSLARFLMDFPKGFVVDHINDDSLDNRRSCNLQAITNVENIRKQVRFKRRAV